MYATIYCMPPSRQVVQTGVCASVPLMPKSSIWLAQGLQLVANKLSEGLVEILHLRALRCFEQYVPIRIAISNM